MRLRSVLAVSAAALAVGAALYVSGPVEAKDDKKAQWGEGVPFLTEWDDAIKEVRESGKMLFVYNGWERPDI